MSETETTAASGLSRDAYLGISSTIIIICFGFVTLRCCMEYIKSKRLVVDDYISVFALILTTLTFATNDFIIQRFADPLNNMKWLIDMGLSISVLVDCSLWFSKAPILFVYMRIFGIKKWMTYTCLATLVLSGLAYVGALIPTFIRCGKHEDPITPLVLQHCVSGTTLTGVVSGFISVFTDGLIFVLPMSSIYSLHLPTGRKMALGAVFFSGVLGIVASAVSLYYKYRANQGKTSDTLAAMLCAVVECTIALIVGCAPAGKHFYRTFINPAPPSSLSSSYPNNSRSKRSNIQTDEYHMMEHGASGKGDSSEQINRPAPISNGW